MRKRNKMIKFEVEGRPISLNQLYNKHWTKRGQAKQVLWWQVKAAIVKYKIPKQALTKPATLDFIFHVLRPIDCDNCAGTCKMIIDFLREWGILKNDSPQYVKKISIQVETKQGREYVEVEINE